VHHHRRPCDSRPRRCVNAWFALCACLQCVHAC
jgi:hypothetical protein